MLFIGITSSILVFAGIADTSKTSNVLRQTLIKSNLLVSKNSELSNISKDQRPDLVVFPFVTFKVQNDTALDSKNIIKESKGVEFKLTSNAYMVVSKNGKMIFNNKSILHLLAGSILEVSDSAVLYISNESQCLIDSGARLVVRGTGKIICENNSSISVSPYSNIILQTKKSNINVNAGSEIITKKGLNVAYLGEGLIFINNKEYYTKNSQ